MRHDQRIIIAIFSILAIFSIDLPSIFSIAIITS